MQMRAEQPALGYGLQAFSIQQARVDGAQADTGIASARRGKRRFQKIQKIPEIAISLVILAI